MRIPSFRGCRLTLVDVEQSTRTRISNIRINVKNTRVIRIRNKLINCCSTDIQVFYRNGYVHMYPMQSYMRSECAL